MNEQTKTNDGITKEVEELENSLAKKVAADVTEPIMQALEKKSKETQEQFQEQLDKMKSALKRASEHGSLGSVGDPEESVEFKSFIANLARGHCEFSGKNNPFTKNQYGLEVKSGGMIATYNTSGFHTERGIQPLTDLGRPDTNKVLERCRILRTNSLREELFPFIDSRSIVSAFAAEGVDPKETKNLDLEWAAIKPHQIPRKTQNFTHEMYEQITKGEMPFYTMNIIRDAFIQASEDVVGLAILNGTGNNEALGLLTDYKVKGVKKDGYSEVLCAPSNLNKVENLIKLIYSISDRVYDKAKRLTIFIHKDLAFELETALIAVYDTPNRNDSKLEIDQQHQVMTLKTLLGAKVDIVPLGEQYGLGLGDGQVAAICGDFQYYGVLRPNVELMQTEGINGTFKYILKHISYAGGRPLAPEAFTFLKVQSQQ